MISEAMARDKLIASLSAATAEELNQPLTSEMTELELKTMQRMNKARAQVMAEREAVRREFPQLQDWELDIIAKIRRSQKWCDRCEGLPCLKPCFQNEDMRFAVVNGELRTSSQMCALAKSERIKKKLSASVVRCRIPRRYVGNTFSDYEVTAGNKRAYQWAKYVVQKGGGLLIYGACGVGKTMLAAITAQAIMETGKSVIFGDVPTILDELKSTFSARQPPEGNERPTLDELMREFEKVDMLVLDDVGTQYSTEWAMERLYMLINNRYNAGKPIIATSNYNAEQMKAQLKGSVTGGRIVSRLTEMCKPVEIIGVDRRLGK